AAAPMAALVSRVIVPAQMLLPPRLFSAPLLLVPGPLSTSGSLIVPVPLATASVELRPTRVPLLVSPRAFGLAMTSVPALLLSSIGPVNALLSQVWVRIPGPSLVEVAPLLPVG